MKSETASSLRESHNVFSYISLWLHPLIWSYFFFFVFLIGLAFKNNSQENNCKKHRKAEHKRIYRNSQTAQCSHQMKFTKGIRMVILRVKGHKVRRRDSELFSASCTQHPWQIHIYTMYTLGMWLVFKKKALKYMERGGQTKEDSCDLVTLSNIILFRVLKWVLIKKSFWSPPPLQNYSVVCPVG